MGKTFEEALKAVIALLTGIYNNRGIRYNNDTVKLNMDFREALADGRVVSKHFENNEILIDPETKLIMTIKFSVFDNIEVIFGRLDYDNKMIVDEFRADEDVLLAALYQKLTMSSTTLNFCEMIFSNKIKIEKHYHEVLDKYVLNKFYYKGLALDDEMKSLSQDVIKRIPHTVIVMDSDTTVILRTLIDNDRSIEFTFTMRKGEDLHVVAINYNDHLSLKVTPIVVTREVISELLFDKLIKTKFFNYYASKHNGFVLDFDK